VTRCRVAHPLQRNAGTRAARQCDERETALRQFAAPRPTQPGPRFPYAKWTSGGFRVVISGAGVAGPMFAFWLRAAGFKPSPIERAVALLAGGRALSPSRSRTFASAFASLDRAESPRDCHDRKKTGLDLALGGRGGRDSDHRYVVVVAIGDIDFAAVGGDRHAYGCGADGDRGDDRVGRAGPSSNVCCAAWARFGPSRSHPGRRRSPLSGVDLPPERRP
jgi:hypothetical protein